MIMEKLVRAAPVALALVLASCGGGKSSEQAKAYCPTPFTVQDAGRLTHFKDGPGRDPRDVAYEATLVGSATSCSISGNRMDIKLLMRVAAVAGPSVSSGTTSVPYFVRIIDGSGRVVQGQDFNADYRLSERNPRAQSQEELALTIPFSQVSELSGYRIAVGLRPTMEELNYNRRAGAR